MGKLPSLQIAFSSSRDYNAKVIRDKLKEDVDVGRNVAEEF